jgi:hypothetical protein
MYPESPYASEVSKFYSQEGLSILTHTHIDCKDIWPMYFDSYKKYYPEANHIVLVNESVEMIKVPQIIYDETVPYSSRLLKGLRQVKTKYVLISFEDMILYNEVDTKTLSNLIHELESDLNTFYIRLIKTGINSNEFYKNCLYKITNSDFLFSITPTIWRVDTLINLLETLPNLTVWDLEVNADRILRSKGINGFYYYNQENKRGSHHYDSSVYPHMCSAVLKGKWNLSEYAKELRPIIEEYKIDVNVRGVI